MLSTTPSITPHRILSGPNGLPLVGNLLSLTRDPLGFLTRCAREYGDIAHYRVLNVDVYLLSQPDYVEAALVANSHKLRKGRALRAGEALFGNGLLTSEGAAWQRQRRQAQPAFHRERIAAYGEAMAHHTLRMLGGWQSGETRDVDADMRQLTLSIAAETLFNVSLDDEIDEATAALRMYFREFRNRSDTALLIPDWLPTPGNLRLRLATRRLDEVIYRIIRRRRASNTDRGDLLSMLLRAQTEDGRLTDQQLRDEVMTLFVAGHETTALALTWALYLLAQHPSIQERLLAELRSVLGEQPPKVNDLPNLPYNQMVIKETLRMYPPVWTISRVVLEDLQFDDYKVQKGSSLAISQWVMHRDPRYFDRPDEFRPDRWTEDFASRLPKFAYFPFGGGPRVCIGASLAQMEAVLLLATIVQRFRLRPTPGFQVELWPTLTLHPKHGMPMCLSPSSGELR